MIIGLTGMPCSGTDAFSDILKEKGFIYFSYSDILREELQKRDIEITRKNLQDIGDEMREKEGTGVLSNRIVDKMVADEDYVVCNIRNPGEVEVFRDGFGEGFVLVKVEALPEVRFKRMVERNRESD